MLPVFEHLRKIGRIPQDDYLRSFNLGVGMIFAVDKVKLAPVEKILKRLRERYFVLGEVVTTKRGAKSRVVYR